ncbi:MAG: peptide chain release factor N(5)-glutamine methyltransferase [Anaerorhabdus sp.]
MISYRNLLSEYEEKCIENGVYEGNALNYLLELTQKNRVDLYCDIDCEVSEVFLSEYKKGMQRILNHEPVQHVVGYSWFYGYKILVNKDVLIPRPETEELVSNILSKMDNYFERDKIKNIVDIGTGSGAIAIALAKEEANCKVYASDISDEALVVAKENALVNDADITFMSGDMLEPFIEKNLKFDVLISNPPYIPQAETLEKSVKDFEPHVALFGGDDGLKFYENIFENCHKILNDKAFMAFEIGYNQASSLKALFNKFYPDKKVEIIKDMNDKDRMLFVEMEKK